MQENQEELSLKQIFELLIAKIWLIILMAVLGFLIAFGISKFVLPVMYRSSVSMYVKSSTDKKDSNNVNLSEINASKSLVETYIVVLKNPTVLKEVGNELINIASEEDGDVTEAKLRKCFTVSSDGTIDTSSILSCVSMASSNGTEVLDIKATTKDPYVSAALCNAFSKVAPDFLVRVVGAGAVETIGAAEANLSPVSPRTKMNCLIGAFGGLFLAVVIIILADLLDNSVKNPDDIINKCDLSVIGEIDQFGMKLKKGESDVTAKRFTILDPDTPFYVNESYKAMRTNIRFALAASKSRSKNVFAVASSNPSEGKSTTAANIAIALAQMDCKVLLVDADLRKPVQHRIFRVNNKIGLTNVLIGMEIFEDCVKREVIPNLDLLSTGTKPPNPSELLASDYTADVFSALSKMYDYVIIDTPPVNVVSDAMVISKSIAGILLVIKYGVTTFDDLKESIRRADLSNSSIIGCVLNGIKRSGGVHNYKYKYKYKYKSYYSYGYGNNGKKNDDTETSHSIDD